MPEPALVSSLPELRGLLSGWRRDGDRVALVPTMGALHEGHLALVRRARSLAGRVVVSIFVNPKQFGASEDLAAYPRRLAEDRAALAGLADLVYAPGPDTMYPAGFATSVAVAGPSAGFEGEVRPGHFDGVATVVAKLVTQTGAAIALFGEKDWQQLQIVRRMVRDLDLPIEIVAHPTVRDAAGLALSSRNAYLSEAELETARRLNVVLRRTADDLAAGRLPDPLAAGRAALATAGFGAVDYLAAVEAETLHPLGALPPDGEARLIAAVRLGRVRLLDNMPIPSRTEASHLCEDALTAP